MSHAATPPPPPAGGRRTDSTLETVGKYIRLIAVLLILVAGYQYCGEKRREAKAEAARAAEVARNTPPARPREAITVRNRGKENTLYRFGSDGCVTLNLRGNWKSFPKGGEISFTDLATGLVVLKDKPGVESTSSLGPGTYRICRVDPSAWGVEILQPL